MNEKAQTTRSKKVIFLEALAIDVGQQRSQFLDRACGDDSDLREQVEQLLEAEALENCSPLDRAIKQMGVAETMASDGAFSESSHGRVAVSSGPDQASGPNKGDGTNAPVIGPYKLVARVGEGGMGEVFVAEQREPVERTVAIKLIKRGMDSKEVIARFEAERQALALMEHPNISRVLEAGQTDDGRPYFVMDYVRGIPINEYCDKHRLSLDDRLKLFVQVCHAVQHAHHKGIIHRDLKPSNVLVELHDVRHVAKVIDFGLAKATNRRLTERTLFTQASHMVGTPLYMSPEQAELSGLDVDTRSDIYSLGVMLYELITGTTPCDRDMMRRVGLDEMRRIIREDDPPRPSVRISTINAKNDPTVSTYQPIDSPKLQRKLQRELDWIVMKALEKDRTRRYETAGEFAADIGRYRNDDAVEACPPSTGYRLGKFAARHRGLTRIAAVAVGLTLVGGALLARERDQTLTALADTQAQKDIAEAQRAEARQQRDVALTNQYRAEIVSGQADWQLGNLSRLSNKLLSHLPLTGERDRRGWEWYYFFSLLHPERLSLSAGGQRAIYSPDRQYIASEGNIWQAETGEMYRRFVPTAGLQKQGDWSPDSRRYAWGRSGVGSSIFIWNRETDALTELQGHPGNVESVAWSPDGTQIAACGLFGEVWLWDVEARQTKRKWKTEKTCRVVAWSPDGSMLGAAMKKKALHVWRVDSGELVTNSEDLRSAGISDLLSLSWHPNGDRLAVSSATNWFLLDVRDWRVSRMHDLPFAERNPVAWRPDGQMIATGEGQEISIWGPDARERIRTLRGHIRPIMSISWSPNGKQIVSSDKSQQIRIWDLEREIQPRITIGSPVESVAWLRGDGILAVVNKQDSTALFWDADSGQILRRKPVPQDGESVWSPDMRLLAQIVPSPDGPRIKTVETTTGSVHSVWRGAPNDEVRDVSWSTDSTSIAICKNFGHDMCLELWDVDREKTLSTWSHDGGAIDIRKPLSEHQIAWSPTGSYVAFGDRGDDDDNGMFKSHSHVYIVDVANGTTTLKHDVGNRCFAWSPDGKRLVAGGADGELEVIDVHHRTVAFRAPIHGGSAVNSVHWSPDGDRIVSGSARGIVKVIASDTGADLVSFDVDDAVRQVAWSNSGRRLVAVTESGELQVWDASRGYEFCDDEHRRGELAMCFMRQGYLTEFLELAPDKLGFWMARGSAYAELANSESAAEEYAKAMGPALGRSLWAAYGYGHARLALGDREAYQTVGRRLMDRFAKSQDQTVRCDVVWNCTLVASDRDVAARSLQMAQANVDKHGNGGRLSIQLAAALYRDGQFEKAADRLVSLMPSLGGSTHPEVRHRRLAAMYFLAMARKQLNHEFQAKRYFDDASSLADKELPELAWYYKAELQQLAVEAEELIGE